MGAYDLIARQYYGEADEEEMEPIRAKEPFKLLIDDDARRAVLERAVSHQPTRGHRNPIKAAPAELDD
ncbi:MAG: hypothetical protein ABIU95_11580 [Burkholderiales bacterium]